MKKNFLLILLVGLSAAAVYADIQDQVQAAAQPIALAAPEQAAPEIPDELAAKALEEKLADVPSLQDIIEPLPASGEPAPDESVAPAMPQEEAAPQKKSLLAQVPEVQKTAPAQLTAPNTVPSSEIPETTPLVSPPAPEKAAAPILKSKKASPENKMIDIKFDNEDLIKVINTFASLQNINVILPSGAQAITQKVTFKLDKRVPLSQAKRYFDTILDIAGYSMVLHGDFYLVVKTDPNANREQLPLYVDVPIKDLPDDGRIQVIYYLQNLKVPENAQGADPLNIILNDTLSPNRTFSFDTKSNAVIISDKASNIKATMNMVMELDSMGVRDVIKQIQLFHTSAVNVANVMQSQIIAVSGTPQGKIRAEVKSEAGLYFAPGTRIVGDNRTNTMIIMGKEPAVERIVNFVRDYVDVPLESGKSILHYYELQYLDSEQFAEVLKKIVAGQGPSGQATVDQGGGPSRAFEGVIIVAEKPVEEVVEKLKLAESNAAPGSQSILKGSVYRGGNRIIVAAKNRDWMRIEKLIKDLDKPQFQVIIQVMIVDFDANTNKIFGTQTRNPSFFQLPAGFNFQAANLIAPPINFQNAPNPAPTTLATDLLALIAGFTPPASEANLLTNPTITQASNPVTTGSPGSLILSLNDPAGTGIWTFLQWLSSFGETRVLSHPYLITRNNTKAEEIVSTIKRIAGDASTGEGGLLASKQQEIEAALKVSVVPRVSSKDRVNLQISIQINNFIGGNAASSTTNNSVQTRELHTNVNMNTGQMLVLGGLSETLASENDFETPLLGKIPVIGWLFSSKKKAVERTNVTIFMIPTIVEPKIRTGLNRFSKDIIDGSYSDIEEGSLFDQMRDPVTYLFFKETNVSADMLDEYLADTQGDFVRRNRIERRRGRQRGGELGESGTGHTTCAKALHHPRRSEAERYETAGETADEVEQREQITQDSHHLKKILAAEHNPLLQPSGTRLSTNP